jgi:hypothetical protein
MQRPGLAGSISDEAAYQGRREDEGAAAAPSYSHGGRNSYRNQPVAIGGGDKELAAARAQRSG